MKGISSEEVVDFLDYVSSERALSQNTRLAYERDLSQFILFCKRKKIQPATCSLGDLREFLATLRYQSLSVRSIARKVSALKQFYKFLLREGRIDSNPSELLSVLVRTRKLPKHLSEKEIFALIEAAGGKDEAEIRDRALLEFWYATGARVSEVAGVMASSIDWEQNLVKISGKGGRERLVPVGGEAIAWCQKYKAVRHEWLRRTGLKETKLFFVNRLGRGFSRQGIWKIVKKYAKRAGIARNVWPHMIRHSFATHVLRGGADLRAVQELLGHRSISTTEVYTHLDLENLKVMQLKYHPRG